MKTNYLLTLLLVSFFNYSQVKIGQDINGELIEEYFGENVCLSADGSTLIAGSSISSHNGLQSGIVEVYKLINNEWIQIGDDFIGETFDKLGSSISISADGSIIAIGSKGINVYDPKYGVVRVYENVNDQWIQIGDDFIGYENGDGLGSSVSLSSNGSIIAIGADNTNSISEVPQRDEGYVRIFRNIEGNWIQIGEDILGESGGYDKFGSSISLSSDGSVVAIGAPWSVNDRYDSGQVKVFKNNNDQWIQIGQNLNDQLIYNFIGTSVSLSSDGYTIAFGNRNNSANGTFSGQVRVYRFENVNNEWIQIGQNINGEDSSDWLGNSVSLSSDGTFVAVGAEGGGYVKVYKYINDAWELLDKITFDGRYLNRHFGSGVSLSSDASRIVIGFSGYHGDDSTDNNYYGQVKVYDLSAITLSKESFSKDYFTYYPNPVQDVLNINLEKGNELKQVNLYSLEGKYLYSEKTSKIDVSHLSRGMYIFEVETTQGKSAKKIVIE